MYVVPLTDVLKWLNVQVKSALPNLDEEIPHPEACPPGHAPLINRLEVLQRGERWRWRELLYRSLSCKGQSV